MGNCGSRREQEKPPTIKSPNGDNRLNNNGNIFKPLNDEKKYRTTPTPFGETGEAKLIF